MFNFRKRRPDPPEHIMTVAGGEGREEVAATSRRSMSILRRSSGEQKVDTGNLVPEVLDDNFLIANVSLPKKDVLGYIRKKSEVKLGPDYYFGYVYRNAHLSFIATRSASYAHGKLSVFTPAFMEPGRYFFRYGDIWHLLETTATGTTDKIVYEEPTDAIDLGEPQPIPTRSIPKTLILQWSLKSTNIPALAFSGAALAISLVVFAALSFRFEVTAREAAAYVPPPVKKNLTINPSFGDLVKKVAGVIDGKGRIKSMQAQNDAIVFDIMFNNESDARAFMAENAPNAQYANGIVTVAVVPASGSFIKTDKPAAPQNPPASGGTQQTPPGQAPAAGGKQ